MNKTDVILLTIALAVLFSSSSFAEEYLLLGVIDGDTVLVYKDNKPEKIDLAGIDAPELSQDYGLEAWRLLKSKLTDEKVRIANVRAESGEVILPGNVNAGMHMVSEGFAWCNKNYDRSTVSMNTDPYCQIETEARGDKKGLWAGKAVEVTRIVQQPQSPQDWRMKNSNDLGFDLPNTGSYLTEKEREQLYKANELKRLKDRLK